MDVAAALQGLTKIDYVDGLGLAVGAHEVSFAHITKRFLRVSVLQAQSAPLPESGVARAEALERELSRFLQESEVTPDQVVLCLPRQQAFVSRLVIPETARGSLHQVVEYEIERFVPLPKEDVYYDYLTYDVGGEERRIGVLLLAVPRAVVDECLAILEKTRIRLQMVTVSSAALASAAVFCAPLADGPNVLVATDNGSVELSFIEKKHLVASHTFSRAQMSDEAALADLIAQGVSRNLPGTLVEETPVFVWSSRGSFLLPVSEEHDLYACSVSRLAGAEAAPFPTASVPALGAALQAVGEDAVGINLLPPERRARREKAFSSLTFVLVGLIFLLAVVWPVSVVVQQRRILDVVTEKKAVLAPSVKQVQEQETEVNRLLGNLKVVDELTQNKVVPLLKNLSEVIPSDVYLTSFRYKDDSVEVSGVAAASSAALPGASAAGFAPSLRE